MSQGRCLAHTHLAAQDAHATLLHEDLQFILEFLELGVDQEGPRAQPFAEERPTESVKLLVSAHRRSPPSSLARRTASR